VIRWLGLISIFSVYFGPRSADTFSYFLERNNDEQKQCTGLGFLSFVARDIAYILLYVKVAKKYD
jgi:hypothetical protein